MWDVIVIRIGAVCLALAVGACAAHRPPVCKGPYTPINQTLAGNAHDTKR